MTGHFIPTRVQGVSSHASPYRFDTTLERLRNEIARRGLKLFAQFDHSAEAAHVGLRMQPTQVLVFGSPASGTPLMVASPLIALELPLRILVWEDGAAQVWVAFIQASGLAEQYGLPAELSRVLAGVEQVVEAALHATG
jgi:uncharacterized protein (DUF302 family)